MTLTRLDKTALLLIAALAVLTGLLILTGNPLGLQSALTDRQPGVYGPLTVEFSAPVRAEAAQIAIGIQPPVRGVWENESETRLRFRPAIPFEAGKNYRVVIQPGALGQSGEQLRNETELPFQVRQPSILYIPNGEGAGEIWRVAMDGTNPRQLTRADGRVFDYHANHDGTLIGYAQRNDEGGMDLWTIESDGENPRLILNCGLERCTSPRWSPNGRLLAFTYESQGISGGFGAPRPWVLEISSGETRPVYADLQIIGYGPSWSPDGRRLAVYDALNNNVRVLELASGEETLLPNKTGQYGGWSPDGRQMFYIDTEDTEFGPRSVVRLADFETGEYTTLMGGKAYDSSYNVPAWAPDGKYIALGMRPEAGKPASQIWIVTLSMLGGPMIPGQPDSTDGFYSWDASSGTKLLFQRTPLKGQYQPGILLYDMNTGQTSTVAQNASWPQWIP
jgi:Tol biopolymer transport system component